jgi:hypothetical protein
MRIFDVLSLATGTALLLALVVVMVRRRLHREYKFFFAYVVLTLLNASFLLAVSGNSKSYYYAYWVTELFSDILSLLALHEAFYECFYGFYLFWWFRLIFPGVVTIVIAISLGNAMLKAVAWRAPFGYLIFSLDSAVSYVKAGIFLAFILLVVVLHVRWRRYPYDIALGFAVSSLGTLVSYALWSKGSRYALIVRYAAPLTYILATGIWLWSFAGRFEPAPRPEWRHDLTPAQLLEQMKEYIRTMKKAVGKRNDV